MNLKISGSFIEMLKLFIDTYDELWIEFLHAILYKNDKLYKFESFNLLYCLL